GAETGIAMVNASGLAVRTSCEPGTSRGPGIWEMRVSAVPCINAKTLSQWKLFVICYSSFSQFGCGAQWFFAVLNIRPELVPIEWPAELAKMTLLTITRAKRTKLEGDRQMVLALLNMQAARSMTALTPHINQLVAGKRTPIP